LTGLKRSEELEARRLARELSVEANTALWQRAVMPDWKTAMRDPNLRKLWWDGEFVVPPAVLLNGLPHLIHTRCTYKASKYNMGTCRRERTRPQQKCDQPPIFFTDFATHVVSLQVPTHPALPERRVSLPRKGSRLQPSRFSSPISQPRFHSCTFSTLIQDRCIMICAIYYARGL
jgi:hypothetical protein